MASRRRWLEHQGERAALRESWQNEWHDIKYQGIMAKTSPCPKRTLKTPLPQQSSSSSRNEENQWVSAEDRQRRRVAFEETAKRMLRYPEDCEDLKVGVTELKEQLEISEVPTDPYTLRWRLTHSAVQGGRVVTSFQVTKKVWSRYYVGPLFEKGSPVSR